MAEKILRGAFASALCLFAAFCLGTYIKLTVDQAVVLQPYARIALTVLSCVSVYAAAKVSKKLLTAEKRRRVVKASFAYALVLYIAVLITFLFFDIMLGRSMNLIFIHDKETVETYLRNYVNLVPLSMIRRYTRGFIAGTVPFTEFAANTFGNLLLFMPFSFLLPELSARENHFGIFFLTMLATSAAAETLQVIFLTGTGDIDDIILNVAGACLLFGLLHTKHGKRLTSRIRS